VAGRFDEHEEAAAFHEGIRLFNAGEWFEAHEVWEDVWHMAEGEKREFYQGLIQAAVMIEHARRHNPRGVRSLHDNCFKHLAHFTEPFMGIDIPAFLNDLDAFIRPILELPESRFAPDHPRDPLPVQWDAAPRIQLLHDPFA